MLPLNQYVVIDYLFALINPSVLRDSPNAMMFFPAHNFPKGVQAFVTLHAMEHEAKLRAT